MIKKLLLEKLKEYGESLVAKHGEQDIGMVGGIVDSYVEKLSPVKKAITKNVIKHIKSDIDDYVRNVKRKHSEPNKIIDVDFTINTK